MFALEPQALDEAAGRIDAVAASLSAVDATGPLLAVGAALPGSATADACRWTAGGLEAALDCWADHLLTLRDTARWVARDAAATDHAVAGTLGTGGVVP